MIWEPEKADPKVGSFLHALWWACEHTKGPILELGTGYFSTPYLADLKREVVSYEFDRAWAQEIRKRFPDLTVIGDFDDVPLQDWSVVLVDCEGWNRESFYNQIRHSAEVIIVHDSQDPWIPEEALQGFKYRRDLDENPRTTVLSNTIDVRVL